MKMSEVKQLVGAELNGRLNSAQKDYRTWREQVLSGKEKNYKKLRQMRSDIARLQTALALSRRADNR